MPWECIDCSASFQVSVEMLLWNVPTSQVLLIRKYFQTGHLVQHPWWHDQVWSEDKMPTVYGIPIQYQENIDIIHWTLWFRHIRMVENVIVVQLDCSYMTANHWPSKWWLDDLSRRDELEAVYLDFCQTFSDILNTLVYMKYSFAMDIHWLTRYKMTNIWPKGDFYRP